jgi:hypothetical protein
MPGTRPGMTSLGSIAGVQSQIPDSVFKQLRPSLRGAKATKQSIFPYATTWIASRSLSSLRERSLVGGAHSRDPLARNAARRWVSLRAYQ